MRWNDLVMELRYTNPRGTASLMSEMWKAAAAAGDDALLGNMLMNQLDAYGVANALDWAGLLVPDEIAHRLMRPREPVRFTQFISLSSGSPLPEP